MRAVNGGDGNYQGLFTEVDVTAGIEAHKAQVPALVCQNQEVLAGSLPAIAVGKQCGEPFACPFLPHSDGDAPEYPLSIFSSQWRFRDRLLAEGYRDVREVPLEIIESSKLQRIWRSTTSGLPELGPGVARLRAGALAPNISAPFSRSTRRPVGTGTT